jgi:tryptophan synthase beta chain
VTNVNTTHYVLGTVFGAYPYPDLVRDFQSVIGREARRQCLRQTGRLPNRVIACVGGGSNAMGIFSGFLKNPEVELIGVEAGGRRLAPGEHAARFAGGRLGVLQGARTLVLQDDEGQILPTHSVSAGLDYAAVGPQHVLLRDLGRAHYESAGDEEAVGAFRALCRLEGILPALESSHAVAYALREGRRWRPDEIVLINLSGRGDKDVQTVMAWEAERGP